MQHANDCKETLEDNEGRLKIRIQVGNHLPQKDKLHN